MKSNKELKKFVVTIIKQATINVEAEDAEHAEVIARDQDADGSVSFDMEVAVSAVVDQSLIADRSIDEWLKELDDDIGVEVKENNGCFGYQGSIVKYGTLREAVRAALLKYAYISPHQL